MTIFSIIAVVVMVIAVILVLLKVFIAMSIITLKKVSPESKLLGELTLKSSETTSEGYSSGEDYSGLEGAEGKAITDLRPAGKALINEKQLDVTTGGNYIKKDSPLRVVKVDGIRILVEEMEGKW